MMTRTILFILFLSTNFILSAQTGQIKGAVLSTQEGALNFANVILKNAADSTIKKAEITNDQGNYTFSNISYGKYFVETSFLGMEAYSSDVFELNNTAYRIPPIVLETNTSELGEVTVTAKRPLIEVLADKTVFNVENTLSSTGTDAFEVLRKAPGVIIDNNDNLILEGKTGVQIYINNKLSPLSGEDLSNYLRSLQASDISAIEIITQPSSKYDAAGNAGIINIRLKKDKRLGTNGTIAGGIAHGRNTRYNSSISFNNRTKSSNLFGTYSNNMGKSWSFIYLDRIQQGVRYDSETESITDRNTQNVKLGYDIFSNSKHTIGFLFNGNFYNSQSDGLTNTPIIPLSNNKAAQILIANNTSNNENYNVLGNVNYRFADTSGYELLLDVDYGRYNRERSSFQPNNYIDASTGTSIVERNFRMNTPIDINIFTVKADYSQPLLGGTFGVGAKYSSVNTDNIFQFYDVLENKDVLNENRSNQFEYIENISAAYVNFNKKWSKWNVQLGLRAEQTISEGNLTSAQVNEDDTVERNYLNWFPSGGLTFTPNYQSSWALTYSRRIQRPNYQSLNPFENQLNELSFAKGNPFLQPQYTNNIKLSHTYKYRLTTSVSYSYIQDFFAQITDTLGATRSFLITRNIANQQVWNVGVSYPFDAAKWWSVYLSVNAFRSAYEGQDEKFQSVEQNTLSFYAQNTFNLPLDFKLEISGWFSSPSVWGGTYQTKSMGSLDIAIQKKFLEDKLSARLAFGDVLFTSPWRGEMQFGDLFIDGTGGWESRQVRFNLSYAFGNNEVKRSRRRTTGLEEEDGRVGN